MVNDSKLRLRLHCKLNLELYNCNCSCSPQFNQNYVIMIGFDLDFLLGILLN